MIMAMLGRTQNSTLGGGVDLEAVYKLNLILKIMSRRSRQNLRTDIQLGYWEN
jgi:uncharacterized membrane protein (GlpM family)